MEAGLPIRSIRLIYPPSLVHEPILYRLIRQFDVTINILQAQISLEEGWLEIEMSGAQEEMELANSFLEDQGIELVSID
jgi:ABC-type methionine transport system ATPase subunit